MTFNELLLSCANGHLPLVKTVEGNVGKVTVIKDNGRHRGVGVLFNGYNYDTWYHDSDDTDKRSRYIRDLTLLTEVEYLNSLPTPSGTKQ